MLPRLCSGNEQPKRSGAERGAAEEPESTKIACDGAGGCARKVGRMGSRRRWRGVEDGV